MTPEEYKKLKSVMYQKYKAGEITNYAYIQWKKKNNPALQGTGGPVSAQKQQGWQTPAPAADPGVKAADEAQAKLEKELKKIYGAAAKEIKAELLKMQKEYGPKLAEMQAALGAGEITQEEYNKWATLQLVRQKAVHGKLDQLTGVMLHANEKAAGMINGQQLGVFAENANYQEYQLTQDTKLNLSFAVYDENTVEKLIKTSPELIPRKMVDGKKDKAWNRTKIASAVTRAVLQGESVPDLAKRIALDTASTNMAAMLRYARTAMTCAQNSGRMEGLHQAQAMGIQVKKVWMATLDSRTRDSHAALDGEKVGIDEKFSNGLMYPGDLNGPPGEVWNCRCTLVYEYDGFPKDAEAQRIQYDEYVTTETDKNGNEKKVAHRESSLVTDMTYKEWKAAKEGNVLNDLSLAKVALAKAQKALIKAGVKEDKVYEGLWKDPVTLADYPAKKASIQAKRDYFTAEIEKYNQAKAAGASWATDEKIKELTKKRTLLNEFEKRGQLLENRDAALKKVQDLYDQVGYGATAAAPEVMKQKAAQKTAQKAQKAAPASGGANAGQQPQTAKQAAQAAPGGKFDADAWSDARKKAAPLRASRYDADKELRPELDGYWDGLSDEEKYAIWEYTRNSNPMNKSLSGYHERWDKSYYMGPDKTDWGHEDSYRMLPRAFQKFGKGGHVTYHKAITDLTKAIEKTVFKRDRWLTRGSDENGLAGMMEGGGMSFAGVKALFDGSHSIQEIRAALVGQRGRNHAFTSTGISTDAGFSGNIRYRIFAPKGTKGVYAEPQSHYGDTISERLYRKGEKYSDVGSEAEVIVQRGTVYRITDVRQTGSRSWEVVMEIVEQPDYFKHGDEDTYNGGKTRHRK